MKTPEELERMAYINGHTEIAGLLAQVIDANTEIEELMDEVDHPRDIIYERDQQS